MKLNNNRGVVLLLAAFIILLSSVLAIGYLEVAATDIEISRNHKGDVIATYIADAGVEAAIYDLLNGGDGNITRAEFTVGDNTYYYTVVQTGVSGNVYTVQSTGEYGNFQRVIETKIRVVGTTAAITYWKET